MDFAAVRMVEHGAADEPVRLNSVISMEVVLRNGIVLRLAENCSMKLMSSVILLVGVE